MQGFPGIFCYILEVKVTDLVSLSKGATGAIFLRLFVCRGWGSNPDLPHRQSQSNRHTAVFIFTLHHLRPSDHVVRIYRNTSF